MADDFQHKNSSAARIFRSRRWKRFLLKKLPLYFLYFLIAMLLFTGAAFAWFSRDLPTPSKIANRKTAQSTKIYDRTGQILLYETGEQKRTVVESDQISQYLKDATVSVEDPNFYQHHGVDFIAITKAVGSRLIGKTNVTRGASTITQQYVKNSFLTSDRSLVRKIKEAILSIELEFMFNKDQILTMYINEIPYGNSTAGAEAAARMYYAKSAKDLTLSEAATLAGIPKAPTTYSPYGTHTDRLIARKGYVLDKMVDAGRASREDADKAKLEDTTTLGQALKPRHDGILAPHFAMYVLEQAANEYGEDKLQKQGLKIITTLDYEQQKMGEQAIVQGTAKFMQYGATNAALTAVDPKTGQILTMVGSRDYYDTSIDGNVNVADSARQPGSSFKPLAYATAFKKKEFSPSKVLFDFQTDFGGGYVPQNYNGKFNGPVTMRQGLSNSLNIPAVKVMSLAGIDNVLRTASDLGITTLTQRERYGLSLVLGSGEVKPVEMAGAFGTFANNGVKHQLNCMLKIEDSDGKTLYEYKADEDIGQKALDPQIAYEIASILSDNDARSLVFGTRSALAFPDRTVAAKTGTTNDFKDAWTVGFTPSIAVAVWVGNSDARKMKNGADGSVIAAPIFHTFIENALKGKPNENFHRPEGIAEVEVEKYSNKLPTEFSKERTKDIFASWQVPTDSDDVNVGAKVCKGTNKLAPADFPAELIENMIISSLHSERPDNPNWENPVRGWANENGYGGTIPTETCTASDFVPKISITAPADGSAVTGTISISADVSSAAEVASVEFYIDSISVGLDSSTPYSVSFDTTSLSASQNHTITAVVTNQNGTTARAEVSVTATKVSSPTSISSVLATPLSAGAVISWITSDPATSQIVYDIVSHSALTEYANSSTRDNALLQAHSATISGLAPNTKYYYRVVSVNQSNSSSASEEKSFTTLP